MDHSMQILIAFIWYPAGHWVVHLHIYIMRVLHRCCMCLSKKWGPGLASVLAIPACSNSQPNMLQVEQNNLFTNNPFTLACPPPPPPPPPPPSFWKTQTLKGPWMIFPPPGQQTIHNRKLTLFRWVWESADQGRWCLPAECSLWGTV